MLGIIIFGTRGVTSTKERGQFHCPECGSRRSYAKKRSRRFFTLYFIPLIPLDLLGEYIECNSCRSTYRDEVLSYDPEAQAAAVEAEFHRAVKRVMVAIMLADGDIDDSEISAIGKLYHSVTGSKMARADLQAEIKRAQARPGKLLDDLAEMGPYLNENGKETVIRAAYGVAAADGDFDSSEQELISQIAEAIQMSAAHLRGTMATIEEGG